MIQIADKAPFRPFLNEKEKKALELYVLNGEKDLLKALKDSGYSKTIVYQIQNRLLDKPAAITYLNKIRKPQIDDDKILTEANKIAFEDDVRPEVKLDALLLLTKLKDRQTSKNIDIDSKTAIPVTEKDKLCHIIEQLKAYKARGQAGLALAEEISTSIYNTPVQGSNQ